MKIPPCLNDGTVPYLLYKRAAGAPDRIAYRFPELGQSCSWRQLWGQVTAAAKGLLRAGIGPGDRIVLLLPDRIEMIVSLYSAACIGAVAVPLNTYCQKPELVGYLKDARAKVMIIGAGCHGIAYPSLMREIAAEYQPDGSSRAWLPARVFLVGESGAGERAFEDFSTLAALGQETDDEVLWSACRRVKPSDPIALLYTSGTTGRPRGVLRTVASFMMNVAKPDRGGFADLLATKAADTIAARWPLMNLMPLYHLGGIATLFINLSDLNIPTIMLQYYHPVRALETLEKERCRFLHCTPYMLVRMLSVPEHEGHELPALIGVMLSGAAVNAAVLREIDEHPGVVFFAVYYGSTEAGTVASGVVVRSRKRPVVAWFVKLLLRVGVMSGDITHEKIRDSSYGMGGKIGRSVQVRVVDVATGEPLPAGVPGEIVVSGPRIVDRDLRGGVESQFTEDGWLRTGDIGYVDEDRCLFIGDRIKRFISRGGEKISAKEVEDCLLAHRGVAEAFVYGVPDEAYGEGVCACVTLKRGAALTAQDLTDFLGGRLSAFKVPRDFVFVDALPISATGKVSLAGVRLLAAQDADGPRDVNA